MAESTPAIRHAATDDAIALRCEVALDARFELDAGTWGICDALCPAHPPRRVGPPLSELILAPTLLV